MSSKESGEAHLKQKRARSTLSCTACRQGKLRCNRATPCDQCIKRSREPSCSYLPPAARSRGGQNVKGRIRHLEQMVVDLMNSRSGNSTVSNGSSNKESPPNLMDWSQVSSEKQSAAGNQSTDFTPPYSEADNSSPSRNLGRRQDDPSELGTFGHLVISKDGTSYSGWSHWSSILDSISELKKDLGDDEDEADDAGFDVWQDDEPADTYPDGLPGMLRSPRRVTKVELLESLPAKVEMDKLVSLWFNAPHPFKAVVHRGQFLEEYQQFWKEPAKAPTMWLGLLYTILSQGASTRLQSLKNFATPEAEATLKEADLYHELAASAAVLSDYTRPKAYTIECMFLYAGSFRSTNFLDVWLLIGVMIRLALRMGYHRDADHYSNISAFSGEMRRRVWHMLYMGDVLLSFQLGLPAMVRSIQSDTKPPHNLLDQDFSVHTKKLPPSRPVDELTPSSYPATKLKICGVFAEAADLSHRTVAPSYSEVMEVDGKLEESRKAIPPGLRFQGLETCITDPPEYVMCRLNLRLLILKSKTVLHRRFMVSTPTQPYQPYSRKCCIQSAVETLKHHHAIYVASQPGGQLEKVSWYMGSIGTQDFILAAAIICLELGQPCYGDVGSGAGEVATREEMINTMETSKKLWELAIAEGAGSLEPSLGLGTYGQNLGEVRKACRATELMLQRVRKVTPVESGVSQGMPSVWAQPVPSTGAWTQMPTETNGSLPGWSTEDYATLDDMMNVSNEIDWELWDHQLSGQQPRTQEQYGWNLDEVLAAGSLDTAGLDFGTMGAAGGLHQM